MSFDQHFNFGFSTVAVAPVPAASGLALTVASAATFTGAPPFNCTVWPANARALATNSEIVRVTAIVGDVFTIERDAEPGGITRTILVGDQIAATITAKSLDDIEEAVEQVESFAFFSGT